MSVLFTVRFDRHPITVLEIRGRTAFLPHELGVAAGYIGDGQGFVDQIVHQWAPALDDDEDIAQLVGKELDALKREMPLPPTTAVALVLFTTGAEVCLRGSHARAARDLMTFIHEDVLPRVHAYHLTCTPAEGHSSDPVAANSVPFEAERPVSALRSLTTSSPAKTTGLLSAAVGNLKSLSKSIEKHRRQEAYRQLIRLATDLRAEDLISDEQWAALRVEAVEELLGRAVRSSLPPFGLDTLIPPRAA